MDIVPRHPHLAGLWLKTRAMVLHDDPWGTMMGGAMENGVVNGAGGGAGGSEEKGEMVNGIR